MYDMRWGFIVLEAGGMLLSAVNFWSARNVKYLTKARPSYVIEQNGCSLDKSVDYRDMTLPELFERFRELADQDRPGEGQEIAFDRVQAIKAEIKKHPGHIDLYREAAQRDPVARVCYASALEINRSDPRIAYAVFEELASTHSGIRAFARAAMYQMKDAGLI